MSTLKVLGLFSGKRKNGPTACDAYRVIFPFQWMNAHGHTAHWMPIKKAFYLTQKGEMYPEEYDVFVLARMIEPPGKVGQFDQFVETLQKAGKTVVCEWDDDYTNRARHVTGAGKATNILERCSGATSSTPGLRDVMQEYNPKVEVVPNCIVPKMWNAYADDEYRVHGNLTIGVVGTKTHYEDWRPVAPALYKIAEKYPEIRFFVGGFVPDYLEDLPRSDLGAKVPFVQYPGLLRQIDIGLAPLDPDDGFNQSKSGVKALEYMASKRKVTDRLDGGVATIATNCKVYRRVVNSRHNGLLVRNHRDSDEWYDAIAQLIEDRRLRLKIQAEGHKWVLQNRTIDKHWRSWVQAYDALHTQGVER